MIAGTLAWSVRHPKVLLALTLVVVAGGEFSRRSLSRDVIPELSDPQVVIVAEWMGHPATDVSENVTKVLTGALRNLPGTRAVRASSMAGMAFVDVVFGSTSALESGRRAIVQRLNDTAVLLPRAARVRVGPEASSTGWVFQYALFDPSDDMGMRLSVLRRFQQEVIRPALTAIPGVAELATVGGGQEEAVVQVRTEALREHGLAFSDITQTLQSGLAHTPEIAVADIDALSITTPVPRGPDGLVLRDVASVKVAEAMPTGWIDIGGGLPGVAGIVIVRRNADVVSVIGSVKDALARARARLPTGARLLYVYDRSELARRVETTLLGALAQEVALVALVVLVFLLHARSAVLPLVTLPLVLLLTCVGMRLLGVPATVMSLGGIAIVLGMAMDADLVALEACHRRLEGWGSAVGVPGARERQRRLIAAAGTVTPAILTSLLIAALAFLPVLAFDGETGRLFRPLAITKTLVIAAAALVALTVAPLLRERLLRGRLRPELDNPLTRALIRLYRPFVYFALERPALTLAIAILAVVSCLPLPSRLGGEFLPRIDEGDLLFMPTTLPGIPADEAMHQLSRQDRALRGRREVSTIFGKVGRAETATDPAPLSMVETTIRLRPRSEWPKVARERWYSSWAPPTVRRVLRLAWPDETPLSTAELVEALDRATSFPGWTNSWTAPARARMDMMSTGARTPVAVRVVSHDPGRLDSLAAWARATAERLPGARSAVTESAGGETALFYRPDAEALVRHQVDPTLVRSIADLVISGGDVGGARLAGRPVRVRVTTDAVSPRPAQELREITVRASDASRQPVPFGLLGQPLVARVPASVRSEAGHPVAYVHVDLDPGVDLTAFVTQGQRAFASAVARGDIHLGTGEGFEWTGQYQLIVSAERRLWIIVPLALISMLGLLFLQFRSLTEALMVLASVPFALVGSFWTLFLLGYPLSAPVWVGLLSVVGLALQTGVVMVVYIDREFHKRVREGRLRHRDDIIAAHAEGTVRRLRPKLMTITTMAVGLLPLLWAEGAGAEIMKRVAAPMLGGLATSAFLTLEVLPVIYTIWRNHQLRRSQREGRPLSEVVGWIPRWAAADDQELQTQVSERAM